uniref:Uncharacterized protein n=1 Tax=Arundo donax TaxID=35708 RepID=A0A0A9ACT8_ARUDO
MAAYDASTPCCPVAHLDCYCCFLRQPRATSDSQTNDSLITWLTVCKL